METERSRRYGKLRPEHDIDAAALTKLIQTAYTDIKKCVKTEAVA